MNQSLGDRTSEWIAELKKGDAKAFSSIYDTYIPILLNFGCKLTTDKELLKDCIHDVFVKLYVKRAELDNIDNFKSYLFISLKNKLCDELRRRSFMSDAAVEEMNAVSSSEDIECRYMVMEKMQWEHRIINKLMGRLSPRQREAITLYYIEEKKYEDICTIMDMNYQSVRNLMHRGLSKLREMVG